MKLRDYQQSAIDSVYTYYRSGKTGNPIIVAATGAGKSLIIGSFIKGLLQSWPNQRILMVTHVKELIQQNHGKVKAFWPTAPVGIYSAGIGSKQSKQPIICGGVQSMYKNPEKFGHRDIVLIDECHLLSPTQGGMYMALIDGLRAINPNIKVVGLSATPWRLKGGCLLRQKNAIFTDIIYNIGIKELTEKGYLSSLISKSSVIQANMSQVKMIAGEFNLKQAEAAVDDEDLTKAALDEIGQLANERKHFLFFCGGVKHAEHVKTALQARGVPTNIITCDTPKKERAKILHDFKHGKHRQALVNNAVLTTGVDLPNIDCIVLLRATASSALYVQMLGRGMRLNDGKKDCLVLDYAGNIERFGAVDLIEAPRSTGKKGDKPTSPPQKICPGCREPIQISIMECPTCGHIFDSDNPKHQTAASTLAVSSGEIKPMRWEVKSVEYKRHVSRKTGIVMLRIIFHDDFGVIASDYLGFEHTGFAKDLANKKLDLFMKKKLMDYPSNVKTALALTPLFKTPKAIYTKRNGTYTEVIDYEF